MAEYTYRSKRRSSEIVYTWIVEDFMTWWNSDGDVILSPIFGGSGVLHTSWRLQILRRSKSNCSYCAQNYNYNYSKDKPCLSMELHAVGKLRSDIDVKSTWGTESHILRYQMVKCTNNTGCSFETKGLCISAIEKDKKSWLVDGNLRIICKVEVGDFVGAFEDGGFENEVIQDVPVECVLEKYCNNNSLSDVTFVVDKFQFPAHKIVLAAHSPVFEAMFQPETLESQSSRVSIVDVNPSVFLELLRFIYTDKVDQLEANAPDLLYAANKYQLDRLKKICEREMSRSLSVENAAERLLAADLHCSPKLKNTALDFICCNSIEVGQTGQWKKLVKSHPHLIIELYERFTNISDI